MYKQVPCATHENYGRHVEQLALGDEVTIESDRHVYARAPWTLLVALIYFVFLPFRICNWESAWDDQAAICWKVEKKLQANNLQFHLRSNETDLIDVIELYAPFNGNIKI